MCPISTSLSGLWGQEGAQLHSLCSGHRFFLVPPQQSHQAGVTQHHHAEVQTCYPFWYHFVILLLPQLCHRMAGDVPMLAEHCLEPLKEQVLQVNLMELHSLEQLGRCLM